MVDQDNVTRLSPEVWNIILTDLTTPDLQTARLICRSLALIATPHLFSQVSVWPNRDCLQSLANITSHASLCQPVKTLNYEVGILPRYDNYEDWQIALKRPPGCHTREDHESYQRSYFAYVRWMDCEMTGP